MKELRPSYLAWLGVGLLMGGSTRLALSLGKPPEATANPNVVVLRGEKLVTLEKPDVPLKDMAALFSKQTGHALTLDKTYEEDKTPYQFLLRKVPLTRALSAIGYLAHGKWERTKTGYHLRPVSDAERASDSTLYEAAVQRAADYLGSVAPDDPSLTKEQRFFIHEFLGAANSRQTTPAPLPLDGMADWKVTASDHGFGISYFSGPSGQPDGKWQWGSQWWNWP
jgi:hypothetical protein